VPAPPPAARQATAAGPGSAARIRLSGPAEVGGGAVGLRWEAEHSGVEYSIIGGHGRAIGELNRADCRTRGGAAEAFRGWEGGACGAGQVKKPHPDPCAHAMRCHAPPTSAGALPSPHRVSGSEHRQPRPHSSYIMHGEYCDRVRRRASPLSGPSPGRHTAASGIVNRNHVVPHAPYGLSCLYSPSCPRSDPTILPLSDAAGLLPVSLVCCALGGTPPSHSHAPFRSARMARSAASEHRGVSSFAYRWVYYRFRVCCRGPLLVASALPATARPGPTILRASQPPSYR
jgi:hypothetical protein